MAEAKRRRVTPSTAMGRLAGVEVFDDSIGVNDDRGVIDRDIRRQMVSSWSWIYGDQAFMAARQCGCRGGNVMRWLILSKKLWMLQKQCRCQCGCHDRRDADERVAASDRCCLWYDGKFEYYNRCNSSGCRRTSPAANGLFLHLMTPHLRNWSQREKHRPSRQQAGTGRPDPLSCAKGGSHYR